MEFKVLGPLEVWAGAERLDLGGARQQIVLATLLLSANKVVSVGRLEEAIYGEALPPTSRLQAQINISSLRRLFAVCGYPGAISTHARGYRLAVDDGELDSLRFAGLVAQARSARDAGEAEHAVASYRDALRLWRGAALDGLDSQLLEAAASVLDEQRVAVNEDRLSLELDLGRHHELVGELTELIAAYPFRERLRGQLMLALYRSDRAAEALAIYRATRQTMVEELGMEPSERLRQLEQAILSRDPGLGLPANPVRLAPERPRVPGLLPADIADFTGRANLIEQVGRQLTEWPAGRRAAPIVVLTGPGGVGKTSLAVSTAHELAGDFPDGQLFADLHAGTARPVTPGRVLERFLRALGVPGQQIPEDLDERAEMYRDLIADRKILVVLDDAAAESQLRPLLPGSPSAAVLITSRRRLGALPGTAHLEVGVLDAEASLALLGRIAGTGRLREQPWAAAVVAEQCGHLPLALRVAGARLAERPNWDIQQLADRLADETRRLDELRHGDLAVRANISLTYEGASNSARRLLRLVALVEAPVFSGWLAAALLDQPPTDADDALDELVAARLVETAGEGTGVQSEYRLHDLIRVYARERLTADEPPVEQHAALQRALGALLYLTDEANRRYDGGDYLARHGNAPRWPLPGELTGRLVTDPLAWLERTRGALVSGVRQAAGAGLTDLCCELAFASVTLFEGRAYFDDWRETNRIALDAALRAGHVRGQATMLRSRGFLFVEQHEYVSARAAFTAAAQLFHDAGDDYGLARTDSAIAFLDRMDGQLEQAAARAQRAAAALRRSGDANQAAFVLQHLAQIQLDLGELDPAIASLTEALPLAQATGGPRLEAMVLRQFGLTHLRAGKPAQALPMFEQALAKVRGLKDTIGEAHILQGIGATQTRLGQSGEASSALQRSLELAGTVGERLVEARALLGLAELALARGDPDQAVVLAQQSQDVARKLGARPEGLQALAVIQDASTARADATATDGAADQPP